MSVSPPGDPCPAPVRELQERPLALCIDADDVPIAAVLRGHLLAHHLRHGRPTTGLVFGRTATPPFSPSSLRLRALSAWRNAEARAAHPDRAPRVPPHLRLADDRRRRQRQGVSTYLGHSSIQITLDRYGHLMPGNEQEAARLLDRYLLTGEDLA